MKKGVKIFLLIMGAIIAITAIIITTILDNKKIVNPDQIAGSFGGNVNNNGLFCEYEGKIYFANAYDYYTMYSMNLDGTQVKKLTKVPVSQINVYGDYIYFYQTDSSAGSDLGSVIRSTGIYRCTTSGKKITCLKKCVAGNMMLVGNYLYFQYYNSEKEFVLSKVNINGGDLTEVADFTVNPSSAYQGDIYFNGYTDNHYLNRLYTSNDTMTTLYNGNVWFPVYQDGDVYYLDLDRNYSLCKIHLATGDITTLSTDRVEYFAVNDTYVYFQTNDIDNPALKRVRIDGGDSQILKQGVFCNINVAGDYAYFSAFQSEVPVYRISNYSDFVETFDAAKSAAMEQ